MLMLVLQEQVVAVFVGREESPVERIYRNIELVLQSELLVLELYVEIVAYIIILNHSSSVSMHASPSRRYISSYFQLVGAQGFDDPREQETCLFKSFGIFVGQRIPVCSSIENEVLVQAIISDVIKRHDGDVKILIVKRISHLIFPSVLWF